MAIYSTATARKIGSHTLDRKSLAAKPPAHRFSLQQRMEIANRLVGVPGIVPNTQLGAILSHKLTNIVYEAQEKNVILSDIIRRVLTFDSRRHAATAQVITEIVQEVQEMSGDNGKLFGEAQKIIDQLYEKKVIKTGDDILAKAFLESPSVERFAKLAPNGHFDPYQYFMSESWGAIVAILDYAEVKGYDKVIPVFIRQVEKLRNALILTYAFDQIS
jgi:hypothetical protein